jgi:hypothetical protein
MTLTVRMFADVLRNGITKKEPSLLCAWFFKRISDTRDFEMEILAAVLLD